MTTAHTAELVEDFRAHLPRWANHALFPTARVKHLVTVAVSRGWTPEQLAADCTAGLEHHYRPGGVMTSRLARDAELPPPAAKPAARKVHHGCCDNGLIYDETTDPPTVTKCPGDTR